MLDLISCCSVRLVSFEIILFYYMNSVLINLHLKIIPCLVSELCIREKFVVVERFYRLICMAMYCYYQRGYDLNFCWWIMILKYLQRNNESLRVRFTVNFGIESARERESHEKRVEWWKRVYVAKGIEMVTVLKDVMRYGFLVNWRQNSPKISDITSCSLILNLNIMR